MATATLEDVAAASADPATLMFQLYVLRDRDFTRDLVQVSRCCPSFHRQPAIVSFCKRGQPLCTTMRHACKLLQ